MKNEIFFFFPEKAIVVFRCIIEAGASESGFRQEVLYRTGVNTELFSP